MYWATTGKYVSAIFYGIAQWFGESVVGLFPLLMYESVHRFSTLPIMATCPAGTLTIDGTYNGCTKITETPSPEICVLAVVASGLALLSVTPISRREKRPITSFTYFLLVMALVALVTASVFYALFLSGQTAGQADTIALVILVAALASSLCLSIESAVLSV
jgi:hypothetical protein